MGRDYYAILGVGVSASSVELRRAYQRLARRYSPDVNLWEQDTRALFEEIAEAYRVLSDATARTLYDRQGTRSAGGHRPASAETRRPAARRGDDLHVPVELGFQQAVAGLEVELPVERLSPCASCGATGSAPGVAPVPCSHCGGAGTVWGRQALESGPCPACEGSGVRVAAPCPGCRGRGVRPARAAVHVVLPPGADTGAQFRIRGEGHSGPFGGPRGDLIVVTRVHEDPLFTRKGDNLYREVSLSIVEALLGARVPVRGVDGDMDLVVPPGTQSGQAFRLRGKGVPRLAGSGRGDLYVTARIEIPRGLDARTQELVRELGRLLPDSPRERARAESGR